ncbi:MAG: hypothetical protein HPY90_00165 [Syntrophothermus sp.]|uniref:hypothetical protein n=1 Tax=Syntrophothermus sp. TaxID=2736299 RepID=UPI00257BE069|nr:hypothetical protein [Syntrophothermus sp.]NSW81678.1 hypothetical protein [Syntrophothermus sp.]
MVQQFPFFNRGHNCLPEIPPHPQVLIRIEVPAVIERVPRGRFLRLIFAIRYNYNYN